jgi:hypothetical protein
VGVFASVAYTVSDPPKGRPLHSCDPTSLRCSGSLPQARAGPVPPRLGLLALQSVQQRLVEPGLVLLRHLTDRGARG